MPRAPLPDRLRARPPLRAAGGGRAGGRAPRRAGGARPRAGRAAAPRRGQCGRRRLRRVRGHARRRGDRPLPAPAARHPRPRRGRRRRRAPALRGWRSLGAAVEPLAPGRALFSADGLVRLHGGASRLLWPRRPWPPGPGPGSAPGRAGSWPRRRPCASRPRRPHLVEEGAATSFLAPMPVGRLPLDPATVSTLEALGVRTAGELAALPLPAVADRFGRPGIAAWRLSRGEDDAYVAPRTPPEPLREWIAFPEPAGDLLVLRGALAVLIDRLLAHPRRAGRPPRDARGVGAAGCGRLIPAAGGPARADRRPAPAARRPSAPPGGASGSGRRAPARDLGACRARRSPARAPPARIGASCASAPPRPPARSRAGLGEGHLWRVVEVAPWSRLPEGRHLLVPFDG